MAASGTGVSHCPEPVYLVGAEVTDIPAMAAADAIKAAGRDAEMFVIGIDGDREALIQVSKGGCLKATISQDFTLMGMTIAFEIVDHLNGKVFVDHLSQLKQTRIRTKLAKQARVTA